MVLVDRGQKVTSAEPQLLAQSEHLAGGRLLGREMSAASFEALTSWSMDF